MGRAGCPSGPDHGVTIGLSRQDILCNGVSVRMLNLVHSMQAAIAAPVIMICQHSGAAPYRTNLRSRPAS